MNNKILRILITGARGFVGKNLVEYISSEFADEYSLFYPYHSELELLDAERVREFVSKNKIDVIIHCASVGGTRKTAYDAGKTDIVSKNLRMFFNLARSLKEDGRMIFLGSGAEYDRAHYMPRMNEDYFDSHVPLDDYGFSKYICSKAIEASKNMMNLRLFGVFGKYEDYEYKFISNSIIKNLLHLPIIINQNVFFDYLYINDCVRLIESFIGIKPKHRSYNLITGNTVDLIAIAKKINEVSDNKSEIIVKNPGLNTEYSGDNSRILKEIKAKFTPLEDALRELFDHYRSVLPSIDKKMIENDEYIKYCRAKK
jgi:GDP-L-fucose synthase